MSVVSEAKSISVSKPVEEFYFLKFFIFKRLFLIIFILKML
jgi:hypothetical protein